MTKTKNKKPKELKIPPRDYQPSRKELRQEHDMPGADMETLKKAFFNPVKIVEEK